MDEDESRMSLFSSADHESYDAKKSNVPPSEAHPTSPTKISAKRASFLAKFFDLRKFKSYNSAKTLVPEWPEPRYEEEDAEIAYLDPAVTQQVPRLWIVRDELGMSRREIEDSRGIVEMSDEFAIFNEKGKVVWEGRERVSEMPIWEKRVDY